MANVDVYAMILGEYDDSYSIDVNGSTATIKKADVVEIDYQTELDVVMTLPESVAIDKGLV